MRYELVDAESLKLLDDPLREGRKLLSYTRFLSWLGKLLMRIGLPIFFSEDLLIRQALFQVYSTVAKKVLKIIELPLKHESNTKPTLENAIKAIDELQKYFNISIRFDKPPEPEIEEDVQAYILLQLKNTIGYQCDRISEYTNSKRFNIFTISENNKDVLAVFFTSELIFLLNNNLLNVSFDWTRKEVVFYPTERLANRLRLFWLNEAFESMSNTAIFGSMHIAYENFKKGMPLSKNIVDSVVNYLLDKVFSIKTSRLEQKILDSDQFCNLREVVAVCSFVEYFESIDIDFLINQVGINTHTISILKTIVENNITDTLTSADNFIQFEGSNIVRRNLSFRYGLRRIVGRMFDLPESGSTLRDFKGDLGKSFEKYVLAELKSLNCMGYKSFEGFKSGSKSPIKGYDIDLILYDKQMNIYYFIQVKYWFSLSPTYLSEQFKFFNGDKMQDGITRQLNTFRKNLEEPEIKAKLRHYGITGATKQNSYFILLHNIPFLNFYESEGVYLYEWNFLRNIIKNCRTVFVKLGDNKRVLEVRSSNRVPLHDLNAIVDEYFKMGDMSEALRRRWEYYKNAWVFFELEQLRIRAKLI